MSGHGISPAWKANSSNSKFPFGAPWLFDPTSILSIYLNCSFQVDEADVGPEFITQILLDCSFQVDEQDVGPIFITQILADCSFQVDDQEIFQPLTTISLTCFTELV